MKPEIIRVHDIHASIKDVGIQYYADRLIQDMAGEYFYVEVEPYDTPEAKPGNGHDCWEMTSQIVEQLNDDCDGYECKEVFYKYRTVPVPLRLAWYIIDTLRLKAQIAQLGSGEYSGPHGGQVKVYLPPYAAVPESTRLALREFFYQGKTDKVVEIPGEMRPVIVEKL